MEWITAIDKRPCERNVKDVERICSRLRRVEPLGRVLPGGVLQQLALCAYYEDLEKGVTVYRQGDTGKCWYALLAGQLECRSGSGSGEPGSGSSDIRLGPGATFGEQCAHDMPRDATVTTLQPCELLRVEQQDFRLVSDKNKEPFAELARQRAQHEAPGQGRPAITSTSTSAARPANPAEPVTEQPSAAMSRCGRVLRALLLRPGADTCLRDRLVSGRLVRRCAPGTELVDWLSARPHPPASRQHAAAMWQALLEENVVRHVAGEQSFKDKCFLYRFTADEQDLNQTPSADECQAAEDQLRDVLAALAARAPDAQLRCALRKPQHERTADELEAIYEELLHVRALAHLSASVRRELAAVVVFEAHARAGHALFRQGDEGRSWYIVLRGSVDVVIHGRGTVTTLREGDDFGKLALVNDAPRAATIVLREPNCHFLRVDKDHFNRILRDVQANTVRLKEHGQDVLVLEKHEGGGGGSSPPQQQPPRAAPYTVVAGTPQKMLEHLLETRLDTQLDALAADVFLDDFLLTHVAFMSTGELLGELQAYYRWASDERDYLLACKRRVVRFVHRWCVTGRHAVFDDEQAVEFVESLATEVEADCLATAGDLHEEAQLMHHVLQLLHHHEEERARDRGQRWKLPPAGRPVCPFSADPGGEQVTQSGADQPATAERARPRIRPTDDIIFRVYCADHTYCTLRTAVGTSAAQVKATAADKLKIRREPDELALVEVRAGGEREVFADGDTGVPCALTVNGRVFVSPRDHLDALTPLPCQETHTEPAVDADIEQWATRDLAAELTRHDWQLFACVHERELLYRTFGRARFSPGAASTANLDVFVRRFNELQWWVCTELCLSASLGRRVALLRKFIKLAACCRQLQNLHAFAAIVMGLSNVAVSRLTSTWDKLPAKLRKLYTEMEAVVEPSRNHRTYRAMFARMQPPVLPLVPLLLKDATFAHEGNRTCTPEGLVNFEKMHMLAGTMRAVRHCRSRQLVLDPPDHQHQDVLRRYVTALRVIDNQRALTQLSQKLEPRR